MKSLVNSEWLNNNLSDSNLIIFDASPKSTVSNLEAKYTDVYIKGARKIDKGDFAEKNSPYPSTIVGAEKFEIAARKLGVCKNSKIVIYDNLGIYMSPRIWWMFKLMGHENVAVLDGGLTDWIENDYPVSSNLYSAEHNGDFVAKYNGAHFRNTDDIKKNIELETELVVDARSEGRFYGNAPEPRPGLKGGHIPNSLNIPFASVLDNGRMKSVSDLKSIFETQIEKPMVFTCGSGTTACILMLAADQFANNSLGVYDGSWSEWGAREDCPVE